jgi:hypothetical protein
MGGDKHYSFSIGFAGSKKQGNIEGSYSRHKEATDEYSIVQGTAYVFNPQTVKPNINANKRSVDKSKIQQEEELKRQRNKAN